MGSLSPGDGLTSDGRLPRLSTASTFSNLYQAYSTDESPSTPTNTTSRLHPLSPSRSSSSSLENLNDVGISTAHQRSSSPILFGGSAARGGGGTSPEDGPGQDGLHRRSSSRVRRAAGQGQAQQETRQRRPSGGPQGGLGDSTRTASTIEADFYDLLSSSNNTSNAVAGPSASSSTRVLPAPGSPLTSRPRRNSQASAAAASNAAGGASDRRRSRTEGESFHATVATGVNARRGSSFDVGQLNQLAGSSSRSDLRGRDDQPAEEDDLEVVRRRTRASHRYSSADLYSYPYGGGGGGLSQQHRVDSHPFSLTSSGDDPLRSMDSYGRFPDDDDSMRLQAGRQSQDSDLDNDHEDDYDEEAEARSPLRPSFSTFPASQNPNYPQNLQASPGRMQKSPSGGSPYLQTPTTNRFSFSSSAGAVPPSPTSTTRSSHLTVPGSPGGTGGPSGLSSGLGRRNTLTVAANTLRRMSLRVVNLSGAAPDPFDDAMSTLRRRRASRNTQNSREDAERGPPSPLGGGFGISSLGPSGPGAGANDEEDELEEAERLAWGALRGRTLGVFGPENWIRRGCAAVLKSRWTEPLILLAIIMSIVILTIQSAKPSYTNPLPEKGYFQGWEDYALFALFSAFTVEIIARIIAIGLVFNPPEPLLPRAVGTSPSPTPSMIAAGAEKAPNGGGGGQAYPSYPPTLPRQPRRQDTGMSTMSDGAGLGFHDGSAEAGKDHHRSVKFAAGARSPPGAPTMQHKSSTLSLKTSELSYGGPSSSTAHLLDPSTASSNATGYNTPFLMQIRKQRATYQQAFLRHSWNRVDLLAVICFWTAFALATVGWEHRFNLYFFRAISVVRGARLLAVTEGTSTILQSLKRAGPQLVNVAFFVVFAMILFSIVGVQAFARSYRRYCQWTDPAGILANVTFSQHCGGFIDPVSGNAVGYIRHATGLLASEGAKGFVCPLGSYCVELSNPDAGEKSFDNIFASLLQVVVVASGNTWTGVMFDMMDADFYISCLFFIVCIIVVNFWLINMFVAVITNTFATIMDETKHSAFANKRLGDVKDVVLTSAAEKLRRGTSVVQKWYERTKLVWVAVIVVSIGLQAAETYDMPEDKRAISDQVEIALTVALDIEILIRLFGYLPDWRGFVYKGSNVADLFLAIATTVIAIPPIPSTEVYPWLTIFQIARFYRVILAIPRMRRLLVRVLGTFAGLVNMIVFLLLINFLGALISVQFIRGQIEQDDDVEMTFYQIFNAFLSMYQIFSSENWTTVLDTAITAQAASGQFQAVITAIFLAGWMLFSFFILLQMFIAVINENFAIAEEQKRAQQLQAFAKRAEPQVAESSWRRRLNPYTYVKSTSKATMMASVTAASMVPAVHHVGIRGAVQKGGRDADVEPPSPIDAISGGAKKVLGLMRSPDTYALHRLQSRDSLHDAKPSDVDKAEQYPLGYFQQKREQEMAFMSAHPTYDRSLWIFSHTNPIRRFCQRFVDPPFGSTRAEGRSPVPKEKLAFQVLIFAAIIASIVVAAIATPVFRRDYFDRTGTLRWTWFNLSEVSLGMVLVGEFLVKVVADGFIFTPNAYLLSMWNGLDFFVLITLIVNVVTQLVSPTGVSKAARAMKALRALRLINLSSNMRETFYNVLIVGAGRIVDASILAILYVIPFAVWAKNIFSGLLYYCTDSSVTTKAECVGEFLSTAVDDWGFMAPRVWTNPTVWSFDNFRSSLLILFEIISLEGWVGVMTSVMGITNRDQQPQQDASQVNAIFFIVYNLIGAVFILTLFVSVIIEGFTRRSGMSLLTSEQRQWLDLRKLIKRQRPAKRPKKRPTDAFRSWCFDRHVQKTGWYAKALTAIYVIHIVVLMTQATMNATYADTIRNFVFLFLTLLYCVDIFIGISGLGWGSYSSNAWHIFEVVTVTGTFATTIPILLGTKNEVAIQLQKLFLVSIAFELVQKNNSLNQLFKTAAASLPAIFNIFAVWIVLFFVYAIAYVEIFSLTRWGPNGTRTANYSSFGHALVMLALASTGEGWNAFMHDYTVEFPRCTESGNYLYSDCGSTGWAFTLFISWNVLSMYLMANLILAAIVENFSYIFQLYGKVKSIDRSQMRMFKKVWAQYDPDRTGYMPKERLVKFLSSLKGVFEVKIYPDEFSVRRLTKRALPAETAERDPSQLYKPLAEGPQIALDVERLDLCLQEIDFGDIKRRKKVWLYVYHEAMLDVEDSGARGISFRNMLFLLAHYKLMDPENSLQLDELVERRHKLERVVERSHLDRLTAIVQMIQDRQLYLRHLEQLKRDEMGLPNIVVEPESSDSIARPASAAKRESAGGAAAGWTGRRAMSGSWEDTPLESPKQFARNPERRGSEGALFRNPFSSSSTSLRKDD